MAFAKDQWTKAVKQADGSMKRERDEKRWGGNRWLGVWIDPQGNERSKAFETKARAVQYAMWMETDRDRGLLDFDATQRNDLTGPADVAVGAALSAAIGPGSEGDIGWVYSTVCERPSKQRPYLRRSLLGRHGRRRPHTSPNHRLH